MVLAPAVRSSIVIRAPDHVSFGPKNIQDPLEQSENDDVDGDEIRNDIGPLPLLDWSQRSPYGSAARSATASGTSSMTVSNAEHEVLVSLSIH